MAGGGDLDGDGAPDLVISELGSSGQDGARVRPRPGFWNQGESKPFRAASLGVEVLVLDTAELSADGTITGGQLPPDAFIEASYKFPSDQIPIVKGSAYHSPVGAWGFELRADFSQLGATSMRCDAYLGGKLEASIEGVTGPVVGNTPVGMIRNVGKHKGDYSPAHVVPLPPPDAITFKFLPTQLTIAPGTPPVFCDELVVTAENQTIFPTEILSMELTGANICDLAILDIEAEPVPPIVIQCPSDLAPPGPAQGDGQTNVDDLLVVLQSWGQCANAADCPADLAPPTGDGNVNVDDLLILLQSWGPCP